MTRLALVALAGLLGGCFDSLLDSPCRAGFALRGGQCIEENGAAPDAGTPQPDAEVVTVPDASETPVCAAVPDDPQNCGACGHVCASGICTGSMCVGEPAGHVVAIGHDFTTTNAGVLRVLGNAAAMGRQHDLAIATWNGSSVIVQALATRLGELGRPWHAVWRPVQPSTTALASIDVVVIDPGTGDGNGDASELEGVAWRDAFAAFLQRGGVVIVLEGAGGTNVRFAHGAGLFSAGAPTTVTGSHLVVVDATDAVAQQVPSPYYAAGATVAFPGLPAVVAAPDGSAVVFHAALAAP